MLRIIFSRKGKDWRDCARVRAELRAREMVLDACAFVPRAGVWQDLRSADIHKRDGAGIFFPGLVTHSHDERLSCHVYLTHCYFVHFCFVSTAGALEVITV